ncbi:MAG TPA: AAA family ATPase, partial [Vicinamibacteria bacterium]|nr:AAA family ATPase [Vicinamibacteria bacterium]
VPAYRVLRESDLATRFGPSFASNLTPLIGREAEVERLRELWRLARGSRGQFVLLTGEAGIGKSRLVAELKGHVGDDGGTRLTCQCWPHFRSSAFYPVIELLLRSTGIVREDSPEEKLGKLEASLKSLGAGLEEGMPLLASLLSIGRAEPHPALRLDPREQKKRTIDATVAMLAGTAARAPTLLVVEDLHWVDHSTLELLGALLEAMSAARLLVLATTRPELQPPWPPAPHLHRMPVGPLAPGLAALLVERAAGGRALPADTVEDLVARTDGVPLFLEELTRAVVDSLTERPVGAPAGGPALPRVIPATLNELFLARLDRLTPAGKEVAHLGAVLGRSFTYSLIRHVSAIEEAALQRSLRALVEAGVLLCRGEPPRSTYQFAHSLIPEAAYQALLARQRREYHLRVAKVLAEELPETAEVQPELLAHHYGEAGHAEPALFHWERAGRRAVEGSANVEAISHFTQALGLLGGLPEGPERDRKELSLQLALGSPLMAVRGYAAPEVEKTYARARALCRAAREEAQLFPAVQGLWQFYMVGGELPPSREMAEQLLTLAGNAGDSALLLLAQRALATTVFLQGDLAACRELTEKGLALYDASQHRALAFRYGHDPGVAHGLYAAWALWLLGYPDQALGKGLAAVALAEEIAHPMSIAFARCYVALLRNSRGEHAAAEEEAEAALTVSRAHRLALWLSLGTMMDGWARGARGQREEGIARLQQGVAAWRQTGARAGMTFFLVTLAEALGKAGRPRDGLAVLDQAAAMVATNAEHYYEAELYRLRGELALALDPGDPAGAEADIRRAVAIARSQAAKSLELRAATSLGTLLRGQGRSGEARPLLAELLAWFTEGFDTADLVSARTLLDRL